jgi:DNA-binding GntR family transcriptional regulator
VRPEQAAKSLTETAYTEVRRDILGCRLVPGEKIKINDISAHHSVSVQAVREALSRLTAEGLVTAEAQRGFRVMPVSRADLEDLTSTRIEIEVSCLRRSLDLGDMNWEIAVLSAFHRLSRTPERVQSDRRNLTEEWVEAHREFHTALAAACGSPSRLRLRQSLYDQSERYRRLSVPGALIARDLNKEHKALMDAALARDKALIAELMAAHLNRTLEGVLPLARKDGPPAEAPATRKRATPNVRKLRRRIS